MLAPTRRLACGRAVAPDAIALGASGWDLAAVPLSFDGRIAFSELDLPSSGLWRAHAIGVSTAEDPALVERELSWARHLALPSVIVPIERAERIEIARLIRDHLSRPNAPSLSVRVPWTGEGWNRWHRVRRLLDWDRRLLVSVRVTGDRPDLDRFLAEHVDAIWISAPFDDAALVSLFAAGTDRAIVERGDLTLAARVRSLFGRGRFEEAPSSSEQYQRAIRDSMRAMRPESIAVLGAGRGELVQVVLQAGRDLQQAPRVYGVDGDENAAFTLRSRNKREWRGSVEVIEADPAAWTPEHPLDLLVLELALAERTMARGERTIPRRIVRKIAPLFAPHGAMLLAPPIPCSDSELCFESTHDAALTGFALFSEAELSEGVTLSMPPRLFELSRPIEVSRGCAIRCFFRRTERGYEWVVLAPDLSAIHEGCGRELEQRLHGPA